MTARPLISLASLLPGTPTLGRGAIRFERADVPAPLLLNPDPPKEIAMPRRKNTQADLLDLIERDTSVTVDSVVARLGINKNKAYQALYQLKKKREICASKDADGTTRYHAGKRPPKAAPTASAPARDNPRALTPLPFSTPRTAQLLDPVTDTALEFIRTSTGEVLVIDGSTITHRIPAAVAEAIRHHPTL